MKKTLSILLAMVMILGLAACGEKKPEAAAGVGFSPSLDTAASGQVHVVGGYDNFEALEAEFDSFNEYYPEVELVYTKVDDYNNMIATILNGNDAPDIYVNYSWMYGREVYKDSIEHAENLADPALGLDLDCIRSNIILNTGDDTLPMVPVFSNTNGMLVNTDLFEKEGLSVPSTYKELVEVCNAFREKGYEFYLDSPTNQQFVILPDARVEQLAQKIEFTHWGKADAHRTICRFVTSWATTDEDLQELSRLL